MKTLFKLALVLIFTVCAACNFTEELYINADGSGSLSINFEGNEFMAAMGEMGDTLSAQKAVDTTFVFKEFIKQKADSIAQLPPEEQQRIKKLENFSMQMKMNPANQELTFSMFTRFKNIGEINNAFNNFQKATTLMPNKDMAKEAPPTKDMATDINYTFNDKLFARTTTITNEQLFAQSLDSLKSAEMFLGNATYTFKYHFPKRVKNTNAKGATFSIDGKTMVYEVSFLELLKNPKSTDFKVEFE